MNELPDTEDVTLRDARRWAWDHACPPGTAPMTPRFREEQALRLLQFIATGSFDAGK